MTIGGVLHISIYLIYHLHLVGRPRLWCRASHRATPIVVYPLGYPYVPTGRNCWFLDRKRCTYLLNNWISKYRRRTKCQHRFCHLYALQSSHLLYVNKVQFGSVDRQHNVRQELKILFRRKGTFLWRCAAPRLIAPIVVPMTPCVYGKHCEPHWKSDEMNSSYRTV